VLNIANTGKARLTLHEEGVEVGEKGTPDGSVVSVSRYPVKSMLGEEVDLSYVTERGLLGDRALALVDQSTGKVVSAKNPRKWGKLFECRAAFLDTPESNLALPSVRITLPDGSTLLSNQAGSDERISMALGSQVKLTAAYPEKPNYEEYWPDVEGRGHRNVVTTETMPARTFFDAAPVHILSTTTLDRLHELYPQGSFKASRFRPNIVIEPSRGAKGLVEEDWSNRVVRIGEVSLRISGPCTRCVMTTLPQGDLPEDLGILRTVVRHNKGKAGIYASVERSGRIRKTDPVWVE
jgi:MOSC domain-containing protein